jgi:hypothetical protein
MIRVILIQGNFASVFLTVCPGFWKFMDPPSKKNENKSLIGVHQRHLPLGFTTVQPGWSVLIQIVSNQPINEVGQWRILAADDVAPTHLFLFFPKMEI